jgi:hypothetical protein
MKDKDFSLEGVLLGFDRGHYRLAAGKHMEAADRSLPLEGETWVPRENVVYAQVIG